jgi:uncharacterized protein (TIGR01777 family)
LRADDHDVIRLVRRAPSAPDEIRWDPKAGVVDLNGLAGSQAIVNVAGAGVADHRWTAAYKRELRDSRVFGTRTIAKAAAALNPRPSVLVVGSAMGYYGDTGERAVDEHGPKGAGFGADIVADCEAAAEPARAAGIRVVHTRSGLIFSTHGNAWARMYKLFRLGLGGKLGNGRQFWSFISLTDEVRAIRYLIDSDLEGPVNVTSPNPVRQAEIAAVMGRVLHRPTVLPVPQFALRIVLGEFSSEILSSRRILPGVLLGAGFVFEHPDAESAVRAALEST